MGLKHSDRDGAEFSKEARSEGERSLKMTPMRESRSHSQEKKTSGVRSFISGELKRKGEPLLSDIPKQARRSPRVQTKRQQEARQSRESKSVKDSEQHASKATRSLESIIREDTARQAVETEKKRKEESEKKKTKPQKSPRLKKMSARKEGSSTTDTDEANLTNVSGNLKDSHSVSDSPIVEEVVSTTFQSSLFSKKVVTSIIGQEVKQTVLDVMTNAPSKYLRFRREDWEYRLVVREEPKTKSVIIRDKPKRFVKAYFKSVVFDNKINPLLDSGYRNFYSQLKRVAREPYPPEPSAERLTCYPIRESTVIKVVPDLQPPNFVELKFERLKLKVQPEPVLDDMNEEQIAEAVRLIDDACEVNRSRSSICVYQDPGTSKSKVSDDDPVGGLLRECQYNPLHIGVLECSYSVMTIILRERPLWDIRSFAEVLPWFGQTYPRLPVPYDLDLPEPSLPVTPPLLQIIDDTSPTEDAYSTSVAIVPVKSKGKAVKPSAAESLSLEQKVDKLLKEMKKVQKVLKKLLKEKNQNTG